MVRATETAAATSRRRRPRRTSRRAASASQRRVLYPRAGTAAAAAVAAERAATAKREVADQKARDAAAAKAALAAAEASAERRKQKELERKEREERIQAELDRKAQAKAAEVAQAKREKRAQAIVGVVNPQPKDAVKGTDHEGGKEFSEANALADALGLALKQDQPPATAALFEASSSPHWSAEYNAAAFASSDYVQREQQHSEAWLPHPTRSQSGLKSAAEFYAEEEREVPASRMRTAHWRGGAPSKRSFMADPNVQSSEDRIKEDMAKLARMQSRRG